MTKVETAVRLRFLERKPVRLARAVLSLVQQAGMPQDMGVVAAEADMDLQTEEAVRQVLLE